MIAILDFNSNSANLKKWVRQKI